MNLIIGTRLDGWGRARIVLHSILSALVASMVIQDVMLNEPLEPLVYLAFTFALVSAPWLFTGLIGWIYRGFTEKGE